ncbi:hypothetical protein GJAV_G00151600 [Gymnothorax javanicus]|nr:hypothetical protein GJAV_G00151600 [Gymnothorax javanicus]
MAFAGLFSSPPNTGPRVSDCPSNEREKAEADEAVINYQGNKKKRKKKKKLDGKGNTNDSALQNNRVPSPGGQLDVKHGPRVPKKNEWFWDYGSAHFSEKNSVSANPRKRKLTKDHLGHCPKKQDFSSELEQYLQVRHAPPKPPPNPPVAVHTQQTGASSQRWKKKKKKRKKTMETGQENPGKTGVQAGNPGMSAYQKRWPQSGRDGKDMRHDRGVRKNQSDGRNGWNGRTGRDQKSGKCEATPKQKKVFLSEDYLARHTVEAQGRRICKYFLRGECQRGDQCNFDHDLSVKKLQVCKFYVQGFCSKETCIYMHRDFPCKFFHAGVKCFKGDACRFSHDPPTDLTRELLEQAYKAEAAMMAELNPMQKMTTPPPPPLCPPSCPPLHPNSLSK